MTTPAEDEMRQQMFKSLVALERMCDAVTDHLTADKAPPERTTEPDVLEPDVPPEETFDVASQESLDKMGQVVAKHHRALALISTFGMMKDKPPLGPEPAGEIARLLGMAACGNCVGTRIDRGEACSECKGAGFLKA